MDTSLIQSCTGTLSKDLDKKIYLQNRRYLQPDDDMRMDEVNFPDQGMEHCPPPKIRDYHEMSALHGAFECVSAR